MSATGLAMTLEDAVEQRVTKLRERVVAEGFDAALFHSAGIHSFLGVDYARYVSGYKSMGPDALVVLPKDDSPTLIVSPGWDGERAREQSPIKDVIATDDFSGALRKVVEERNLRNANVAMPGQRRLLKKARDAITTEIASPLASFDAAFDDIACIRDDYEIGLAREAATIANRAHDHMLEYVRVGMIEYKLAADIVRYTKSLGADDNFLLLACSQANTGVRAVTDRVLDVGDFLISEITPSYGGQFTQITRTAHIGRPTDEQIAAYELLVRSLDAGLKTGRPGVTVGTMVSAIDNVLCEAGYPHLITGRRRGHGLGLGSVVPGNLTADNEVVLRKGMIFTLHPNQYLPPTGYVMSGQPVLVTDDGLELLCDHEVKLEIIEA